MCKNTSRKVGVSMLRSEDMEVAGGDGEEVQHKELYWQPVCLFSMSPEDLSQTTRSEVTSCTRVVPRCLVALRRFLFC